MIRVSSKFLVNQRYVHIHGQLLFTFKYKKRLI